jgi:plasmid segregation protein ParM
MFENVDVLATDIGYSYVKYAFGQDEGKFPSAVTPVDVVQDNNIGEKTSYSFNGRNYFVGERALRLSNVLLTRSENFLIDYSPLFICEILKRESIRKVGTLCLSLSIAEFKSKYSALENACRRFIINNTLQEHTIEVFPQGFGIWAYCERPRNAVVVDIGFNTIDVLGIENGEVNPEYSFGYKDIGVCIIASVISDWINKNFDGAFLSEMEANEILVNNGEFSFFRRKYNVSGVIERKKAEYTQNILGTVFKQPKLRDFLKKIDAFIIAGGGAYFIDENLKEKYGIYIPENPEYSNVLGFLSESSQRNTE